MMHHPVKLTGHMQGQGFSLSLSGWVYMLSTKIPPFEMTQISMTPYLLPASPQRPPILTKTLDLRAPILTCTGFKSPYFGKASI